MALALVFLAGCEGSTIFKKFDIEQTSLSLDAKQRTIISRQVGPADATSKRIVCAEPSPDALVAVAQAAAAQAQVAGKGGGGISFSMSESAASIGIRTATIQLLRDALYRACEAYANGAIDNFGYALILNKIDDVMLALLGIEGLTRIPPAVQVAIGTKGKSSFKGSQSGGQTEEGTKKPTPESQGEGEADTGALTAAFKEIKVDKYDVATMRPLADAITKLARRDRPGSTVAGACLMWLSTVKDYKDKDERHKKMIEYCDKAFEVAGQAAKFEAMSRLTPTAMCMVWLTSTKAAERDADTASKCIQIVTKSIEAQATADAEAKAKKNLADLETCLTSKIKGTSPNIPAAMKACLAASN